MPLEGLRAGVQIGATHRNICLGFGLFIKHNYRSCNYIQPRTAQSGEGTGWVSAGVLSYSFS